MKSVDTSSDPQVLLLSTVDRRDDPTFDWANHAYPYEPVFALKDERTLTLTLIGSSSCPQRPARLKVLDAHAVRVTIHYAYGSGATCIADAHPMTYIMKLNDSVDRSAAVRVQLVWTSPGKAEGSETSVFVSPSPSR